MDHQSPSITEDELRAFHEQHFASENRSRLHSVSHPDDHLRDADASADYYPDGMPRTLTEEEVAIFQHSELHALLRARELRREAEEGSSASDADTNQVMASSRIFSQNEAQGVADEPKVSGAASPLTLSNAKSSLASATEPRPKGDHSKRLWQNKKGRAKEPEHLWTSRRRARAADELKTESVELDY